MDADECRKAVRGHEIPDGFIKVTDRPVGTLTPEQKVALNRKGNVLFNEGRLDEARRIFVTTGYSDGLTRVGDAYGKRNESLTALKYYVLANNARRAGPLYERLADIVSCLLRA